VVDIGLTGLSGWDGAAAAVGLAGEDADLCALVGEDAVSASDPGAGKAAEFGGRHELYERNYSGNQDQIRIDAFRFWKARGDFDSFDLFVEKGMSEYDVDGWTADPWASAPVGEMTLTSRNHGEMNPKDRSSIRT
jgi:hypothetical protein